MGLEETSEALVAHPSAPGQDPWMYVSEVTQDFFVGNSTVSLMISLSVLLSQPLRGFF